MVGIIQSIEVPNWEKSKVPRKKRDFCPRPKTHDHQPPLDQVPLSGYLMDALPVSTIGWIESLQIHSLSHIDKHINVVVDIDI